MSGSALAGTEPARTNAAGRAGGERGKGKATEIETGKNAKGGGEEGRIREQGKPECKEVVGEQPKPRRHRGVRGTDSDRRRPVGRDMFLG